MTRVDVPSASVADLAWVLVCPACGLRGTWPFTSHLTHPGAMWHDCPASHRKETKHVR